MKQVLMFCRQNVVLCVSFLLALGSAFLVHPSREYFSYIDFRTLSILLSLMLVVMGLRTLGLFRSVGKWLLEKTGTVRSLSLVLVCLNFFFSMFITNDVALITFVPFTVEVFFMAGLNACLIRVLVLQTIAANLGSMLTPIGNPQNIYLYSKSGLSMGAFLKLMLPYSAVALLLLILLTVLLTKPEKTEVTLRWENTLGRHRGKLALYLFLFLFSLTAVTNLLPYYLVLAVVVLVVLLSDWHVLLRADYVLLLTFVFLFIFIGNMKHSTVISDWLMSSISGNELLSAVLVSQVISNVPAAILLSGFTEQVPALIVGTNLGGLGTLIASMASLITYNFYIRTHNPQKGKYFAVFTAWNLVFLAVLLLVTQLVA